MANAQILTLRGMVDAIIALDIPSVRRVFPAPPENVSTADLPAMWPALPSIATNDREIFCKATTEDIAMSLFVAVEPYGQDTQANRFDLAIALGDELRTAFNAWEYSLWLDYDIAVTTAQVVAQTGYWGIIAELTARNA